MAIKLGSTNFGSVYLGSTKIGQAYLGSVKVFPSTPSDPYNPLNLPDYTARLQFASGATPSASKGTFTQVSSSPNVWDWHYENTNWTFALSKQYEPHDNPTPISVVPTAILGMNAKNVTNMSYMFSTDNELMSLGTIDISGATNTIHMFAYSGLTSANTVYMPNVSSATGMFYYSDLTATPTIISTSALKSVDDMFANCNDLVHASVFDTSGVTSFRSLFGSCTKLVDTPLFDTSSGTNFSSMYYTCKKIKTVPLYNTAKATTVMSMFCSCWAVQSGALALYQQMSTQATPPSDHRQCFTDCGYSTTTGAAELAQIPADWGGTAS